MSAGRSKQPRLRERLIAALLTEPTHEAAANRVGISEATLQRWLRDPMFQTAYRAARRRLLDATVGRLLKLTGRALDTLERNLDADKASDQNRAAVAILEHATRGAELLDTQDRVAELERVVDELLEELKKNDADAKAS